MDTAIQDHFHFHHPFCNPNRIVAVELVVLAVVALMAEEIVVGCFV